MSASGPEQILEGLVKEIGDVWTRIYASEDKVFKRPDFKVVTSDTPTPCGTCVAGGAPFYCEKDHVIYLGEGFLEAITEQAPDPGTARFVVGTVLAHEIGHYVQFLNGTGERLAAERAKREAKGDHAGAMKASIELELQADSYSGIWAHTAISGMTEQAKQTALAATSYLAHAFDHDAEHVETHGTGDQRMAWFDKGLAHGDPKDCALPQD